MKTMKMKTKMAAFILFMAAITLAACSKEDTVEPGAKVVYEDDFTGTSKWPITSNEGYLVSLKDGKYIHELIGTRGFNMDLPLSIFTGNEKKQIVEYTLQARSSANTGTTATVISFNLDAATKNGKNIYISDTKYYQINSNVNGELLIEKDWTLESSADLSKKSVVKVELENSVITIYYNGKLLYRWTGSGAATLDRIAIGAIGWGNETITVEVDRVRALAIE